jgi:hypothetical protein
VSPRLPAPGLLETRFTKLSAVAYARSEIWPTQRRQRLRRRYSARVLDAIHTLMIERPPGVVPKSLLGRGDTYLPRVLLAIRMALIGWLAPDCLLNPA